MKDLMFNAFNFSKIGPLVVKYITSTVVYELYNNLVMIRSEK